MIFYINNFSLVVAVKPATLGSMKNRPLPSTSELSCTSETKEENPAEQTSCPTPLGWKKVVSTFTEEATDWTIPFQGRTIKGKTWGTGPVLLLVGNLTNRLNLFSLLIYLLRENFTCLLLEPSEAKRHSAESLAEELLAVADYHHAEKFHLYASGFGAVAGLTTLLNQPQRVDKMILQGGFAHRQLTLPERFMLFLGKFSPGRLRSLPGFRSLFIQNHLRWFPPFDGSRWQFLEAEVGEQKIRHLARLASVLKSFDLRDRLSDISHNVLILKTEGDGIVLKQHQQRLISSLLNAKEEHLQHTGYLTHLTHPHRIAKIVRPFLLDD